MKIFTRTLDLITVAKNNKKNNLQFFKILKNKLNSLTITDIKLRDGLIYCSYNLLIALRIHHLSIIDKFKLPKIIINSFAFKHFSEPEKDFLFACDACNDTLNFSKNNPKHEVLRFSTGKEILIMIYDHVHPNNMREFKINDLSKFTGLCRRYRTPTEVEKIITSIFMKDCNV